jgi:hypothetical protein
MNTDMDSPGLFAADGHPDENQLLLALEKELSPDEAARVEQHLGQCWSCRARFDEMERGILSFVEYRERRYLPSLPEPPHDPNFPRQLRHLAHEMSSPALPRRMWERFWKMLKPRGTLQWASLVAGGMAALLFWTQVVIVPPSLTAAEILSRATAAQNPPVRTAMRQAKVRRTAHQKARVRSAGKTVVRDFHWVIGEPLRSSAFTSPDNAMTGDLPLTAAAFSAWHEGLRKKTDRIKRWGDRLTLITNPVDDPVIEASLMVRLTDFHPMEQRIRFAGGREVDIEEIGFEVVEEPVTPPAPAKNSTEVSVVPPRTDTSPRSIPASVDLDETEFQIRYVMFSREWDLGEDVSLSRTADRVVVTGTASSRERANSMRSILSSLPGAEVSVRGPEDGPSRPAPVSPSNRPAVQSSTPILEEVLSTRFGSIDERREFVDRCLTASDSALSHAWALRNLAQRYTEPEEHLLSGSSRTKFHEMLRAHMEKVAEAMDELKSLSELLPSTPITKIDVPGEWNAAALSLFEQVQEQDSTIAALIAGSNNARAKQAVFTSFRSTYNNIGDLLAHLKSVTR